MKLPNYRENIAIIISIFSLLVSMFSIYLSVNEVDSVKVRVVGHTESIEKGKVVTRLVFSNAGNLPYFINDVQVLVSYEDGEGGVGIFSPAEGESNVVGVPFVLDKGEIKVVEIATSVFKMVPKVEGGLPVYFLARISAVNIHGKLKHNDLWFASMCIASEFIFGEKVYWGVSSLNSDGILMESGKLSTKPCEL